MQLKFGKITEVDAPKGIAKVTFEENDDLVSGWLPMMVPKSKTDQYSIPFDINEHVCCMMDANCEDGVIMGAIYDAANMPEGAASGKIRAKFDPNMTVEYDRATSTLLIDGGDIVRVVMGTTELKINDGFLIQKNSETLKKILNDLNTAIKSITVPTNVGPSGVPINSSTFTAINIRVNDLLK